MSDLPTGWKIAKLSDVCTVLAGYGFPERLQECKEGELPFFKVGDISESWKRGETFLHRAEYHLTPHEAEETRARPFQPGRQYSQK